MQTLTEWAKKIYAFSMEINFSIPLHFIYTRTNTKIQAFSNAQHQRFSGTHLHVKIIADLFMCNNIPYVLSSFVGLRILNLWHSQEEEQEEKIKPE